MRQFFNKLRRETKPSRVSRKPRRLSFQDLESRTPLAGDVAVWLAGDVLHIQGDSEDNTVRIAVENGKTKVRGLNSMDGEPTSINGSFTTPFFVAAGLRNIEVEMGDGNDIFLMVPNQQYCAGNVAINMGRGHDEVTLQSVTVTGDLSIRTAIGGGGDTVLLNDVDAANISIDTAEGDDTIDVRSVVTGRLTIDSTSFKDLDDNIGLVNILATSVQLTTGSGIDTVGLGFVTVTDTVQMNTGSHNDVVRMNDCDIDGFFASMGEGDDLLDIRTSAFEEINLAGQGGSRDELTFTDMEQIGVGPITGFEFTSNTNNP